MTEGEISEPYVRLAFQYKTLIDTLLSKRIIRYRSPQYIEREVL